MMGKLENRLDKSIVFDVETTGLDPDKDEIVQLSIISGHGDTLFSSYVKPERNKSWKQAEAIHHITPEMVKDAPYARDIIPQVKEIFDIADTYIGYNVGFDLEFVGKWGISAEGKNIKDVMKMFAPIYGEYSEYYGTYKWQKLVKCAAYYGYEFQAHDSLEDVRATLHCYLQMETEIKNENEGEKVC